MKPTAYATRYTFADGAQYVRASTTEIGRRTLLAHPMKVSCNGSLHDLAEAIEILTFDLYVPKVSAS